MELIDDNGRLFGVVNIIDALAVLLAVAVATAGAAFVFADDPEPTPETDTTYATLDMGVQEPFIVEAIEEGDTYEPDGTSTLRVTDVHLSPADDGVRVFLRVALEGHTNAQESLVYAGAPPRLGRSLDIVTNRYELSGQIRDVGSSDAIERKQQAVILSTQLDTATAKQVTPGDEVRVAGRTVAKIENVTTYATVDPKWRQVFVSATIDSHRQQGELRFGDHAIRRGQSIILPTSDYVLDGKVEQVGGEVNMGETTTRTVTLRMSGVREDFANAIVPGMVERAGNTTIARVTDVESEPSLIILTGDDAEVNVVDHPINRDVTISAELQLRETPAGLSFKGDQIRQGSTIVLNLETASIEATVVTIERQQ